MGAPDPETLSTLVVEARRGDQAAREKLVSLVYPELRRIAAHFMRRERPDHTLQTTALVHEAYLRLFGSSRQTWQSRAHFFAAVATEMRRVLVDHARARDAHRRVGKRVRISLADIDDLEMKRDQDLVDLDEALSRFEQLEPRASRVVELRFFVGLDERETAEALDVSVSTLKRDWTFAKAWLLNELQSRPSRE